jgi:hypothetical protein
LHLVKDFISRSVVVINDVDLFSEHSLEAFLNTPAAEATHWATSFSNIFFSSDTGILIVWIPSSECESIALFSIYDLLSNYVQLLVGNDFPLDSHISHNWVMKSFRGISIGLGSAVQESVLALVKSQPAHLFEVE